MSNSTMRSIRFRRFSGAALAAAAVIAGGAATAHADTATPVAPSSTDLTAARTAATGSLDTVGRFFAAGGQRPQGTAEQQAAAGRLTAPRIDSATVPVFYLNPAFVTGGSETVANLAFLATDAVSSSGAHASVWTTPDPHRAGAWTVVNIASGSDETAYAAQAGAGATAFEEPQIGAWYALRGGRVTPLNEAARESVGAGTSVAAYQRMVHARYADKMPGSAYDRDGIAGGFNPGTAAVRSGTADSGNAALLGTGGVLLAAAGFGRVAYRRSRTR